MSEAGERTRRRRRPEPPARPPTQGSVVRGVVLVVVALVIGLLLLRDDDAGSTQVAVGTDRSGEVDRGDDGAPEDDGTAATTSTTAAPRPPAEVKVLVANGSGTNGAAGGTTDALEALGYVTWTPTNAERVPSTVVYFTDGYQPEAEALAEAIGAPAAAVTQMPAVAPVDDLQLANILVVVGPDLASA